MTNLPDQRKQYIQDKTPEFWRSTLALSVGGFAVFSNFHLTQPLLPLFSKEFGVSPVTASLSVSLVTLTLSVFLLVFGPVSDAVGRKNVMAFGLLVPSLISIGAFFVPDFGLLLVLRTLQGLALAALPAISYAYIGEEFDGKAVGVAIGLYISANSVGGMAGRIISGFAADIWGWRYSFLIMGFIGLACLVSFLLLLPKSRHFVPHKLSLRGAGREMKQHIKNSILRDAYYIAAILFFVFIGLFNYLSYHLHAAPYFLSTALIGLLYLSYSAGTFSSTLSGKLEYLFTIPQRILIGLGIMVAGILLMTTTPLLIILIGLVVLCFGFFFAHAASSSWVSRHAKDAKGSASALYLFAYYMGGSIGSTLLGYIWDPWGWKAVAYVCIGFVLLGMLLALRMKKTA